MEQSDCDCEPYICSIRGVSCGKKHLQWFCRPPPPTIHAPTLRNDGINMEGRYHSHNK